MNEIHPKDAPHESQAPACTLDCGCRGGPARHERGFISADFLKPLRQPPKVWLRGIVAGLATGILAAVVMIALKKHGFSPVPMPLGLAFADTLLHKHLPLPVGLVFHLAYVTFWGTAFVLFVHPRLTLARVAGLSAALYLFAMAVFVPVVGWGFFGSAIGPRVAGGLAITHALFGLFLWLTCRLLFRKRPI
ncbi:MAG: hypothetical protein ACRER1_08435 [Gammaproteobacteria bacterium]